MLFLKSFPHYYVFFIRAAVCCLVSFAVAANIIFSSFMIDSNINFTEVSNVQKDVFSTLFFISDVLNKFTSDISGRIIPQKNSDTNPMQKKDKKQMPVSNDGILQPSTEKTHSMVKDHNFLIFIFLPAVLGLMFYSHRMRRSVVIYFVAMMLFFASAKNMIDSFMYKFIKIYSDKPAFF